MKSFLPLNLIARAEAILKQIFANAPLAVKYSIEAVNKGLETSQSEGLSLEASFFGLCAGTEDKKEGTAGFSAKAASTISGTMTVSLPIAFAERSSVNRNWKLAMIKGRLK